MKVVRVPLATSNMRAFRFIIFETQIALIRTTVNSACPLHEHALLPRHIFVLLYNYILNKKNVSYSN